MNNFRFWRKVMRPEQSILAACSSIAILLFGEYRASPAVILALGCAVACNVLGASLFHYGAAKKIYARKYWDRVDVQKPVRLISYGLSFFLLSILIGMLWLNGTSIILLTINTILICLYARMLSKYWVTKNIIIAYVCTTPLLLGWTYVSGQNTLVITLMISIFFSYIAREIIKDINDIEANNGIRVTLPIWLKSTHKAMNAAYVALLFSIISLIYLNSFFSVSLLVYVLFWISIIQLGFVPLITKIKGTYTSPFAISVSNAFILLSVTGLAFMQ